MGNQLNLEDALLARQWMHLVSTVAVPIRDNIVDVDAMEKEISAIFHHSASTDKDPQHQFCPVGEESWCKYQHAIALSQDIPPANNRIPPDLVQFIRPVFEELTDRELLDRCILDATQNQKLQQPDLGKVFQDRLLLCSYSATFSRHGSHGVQQWQDEHSNPYPSSR